MQRRSLLLLIAAVPLAAGGAFAEASGGPQAGPGASTSASASASASAAARASHHVEVLVLHGTNSGKGIDERIGKMPELSKPPFNSYDSYELLNRVRHPLLKDSPRETELPNGRILRTQLLEVLPKDYLRISASINQPRGKQFLPLLEVKAKVGQAFIVAGQSYKGGILVLVIRVVK